MAPFGVILGQWWPLGVPKGPKAPQCQIFVTFGARFGSPRGALWGHFGPKVRNRRDYVDFLVPFFRSQKKKRQQGSKVGGGHAIHPRRRMFREGRPSSLRLHFGLHFGVILGAKFATILLFGCAGPYFWVILEPFKTRVAFRSLGVPSGQVAPYWSHTWGKGGRA